MIRILIFIGILMMALPYIKKASNAVMTAVPDTASLKQITRSVTTVIDNIKN